MANLLGETTDVSEAMAIERDAPPGLLEVRLNLLSPISQEELNGLHNYFLDSGVDVKGCLQQRVRGLYQISIKYQKHAPSGSIAQWSLLIPLIPTALIGVLVAIGIFKIESIMKSILPIVLAVGGFTIISLAIVRKPLEAAAGPLTEAYVRRKR